MKKHVLKSMTIRFSLDSEFTFIVWTNMNEQDLENALFSWSIRTNEYTDCSFCYYIMSKNSGHLAYTDKQYKELK